MSRIYLHFTGTSSQYYTPRTFLEEARKIGFGRVVPFLVPFGSQILFATYKSKPKIQGQPQLGRALIYAIGVVTGWHVKPKTENASLFWRYYISHLEDERLVFKTDPDPIYVIRRCGSYVCEGGIHLFPSVDYLSIFKELLKKWNEENPDRKVSIHDFQWIITGPIIREMKGMTIGVVEDVKFSRGLIPVENTTMTVFLSDENVEVPLYQISTVKTYERNDPIPTKELWKEDFQLTSTTVR